MATNSGKPRSRSTSKSDTPKTQSKATSDKDKSAKAENASAEEPMGGAATLGAGDTTYNSTVTTAGTAEMVTFPSRFGYLTVTNLGTNTIYVRTDGQAASAGNDSYVIPPNSSRMIANGAGIWYQSQNVIPHGVMVNANGPISPTNPSTPSQPAHMQEQEAAEGGPGLNPGTKISVFAAAIPAPYVIEAAG